MARWIRAELRLAVCAALAALLAGASAHADEAPLALRFWRHGEAIATLELAALRAAADARTIRVFEPYEGREVAFLALPFAAVLDRAYSPSWRDEEELLFTCRDGYQPSVPVRRALEHRAWLAFARAGAGAGLGADFTIDKLESGRRQQVSLGPFYLIWENLDDPLVLREGDYGWPYQLVGVDLVRARDRFPHMAPPGDAPPPVQEGFAAFRIHCSRCHTIHGEGGAIGPELNAPGHEVGRRDPAWLRRWIDDPSRIAANARMPALNPALPERDAAIDAIVAYLRAMAAHDATP